MSKRSSHSPAQHASRPFSPSPPRENRHTSSRPPSMLFGAPPISIVAPSTAFPVSGLPPTPSPPFDPSSSAVQPKDLPSPAHKTEASAVEDTGSFFDSPRYKSRGRGWDGIVENEAEWIRSGGRRQDGTIEGEFVRARIIPNGSDPRSDSESSSGSASPPLGATSLLAALAGASSPPRSTSPSPRPGSNRGLSTPGSTEQSFSSLFQASQPFPDEIKEVPARRSVRSSIRTPSPSSAMNASKLPRLQQPTVIRSTSGRGLAFLPPAATISPTGPSFSRMSIEAGSSRRQSSASESYSVSSISSHHPPSVSLTHADNSPQKSLIPRRVSKLENGASLPTSSGSPSPASSKVGIPKEVKEVTGVREESIAVSSSTSAGSSSGTAAAETETGDPRKVETSPSPSQIPRWKSPNLEKRQGSYILSRPSFRNEPKSEQRATESGRTKSKSPAVEADNDKSDAASLPAPVEEKLDDKPSTPPRAEYIDPTDADKVPAHQIAKRYEGSNGSPEMTLHEVIEQSKPDPSLPSSAPSSPATTQYDKSDKLPYVPRKARTKKAKSKEDEPLSSTDVVQSEPYPRTEPTEPAALNIQLYAGLTRHTTTPLPISAPHVEMQLVWPEYGTEAYRQQWFNWVPGRRLIPSWGVRITF